MTKKGTDSFTTEEGDRLIHASAGRGRGQTAAGAKGKGRRQQDGNRDSLVYAVRNVGKGQAARQAEDGSDVVSCYGI